MTAAVPQAPAQEISGNTNMQSAILELDNAQVDVRNDLLNLKAKYSDVDAQYNLIKNERKVLNKQIKTTDFIEMDNNLVEDICKIVGVYLDNAIEAVENLNMSINKGEIYEIFRQIYSSYMLVGNYVCKCGVLFFC